MPESKAINNRLNGRALFFQEFLKHPRQIGSIIPSSRFLEQRVIDAADISDADVVVELGPGTGGMTQALLRALPAHARLLSIEINSQFHALVSRLEDERLIAHLGSACDIDVISSRYGLAPPNAVVSGIPFSTMSPSLGSQILEKVASYLAPNGRFVAYQFSTRVATLCRPFLGTAQSAIELLNIPPMHVFRWQKQHTESAIQPA